MPPCRARSRLAAAARRLGGGDEVAGAVADQRRAVPAKRGQHQFAGLASGDRLGGFGVDDFRQISLLEHMQHAGLGRALIGHRADFGHAVMIENLCAGPSLFEPRACGGDAAARFAGDNDRAHRRLGQVDAFLLGHFGQAQGVRRRAAEDIGVVGEDGPQSRRAASGHRRGCSTRQAPRWLRTPAKNR